MDGSPVHYGIKIIPNSEFGIDFAPLFYDRKNIFIGNQTAGFGIIGMLGIKRRKIAAFSVFVGADSISAR